MRNLLLASRWDDVRWKILTAAATVLAWMHAPGWSHYACAEVAATSPAAAEPIIHPDEAIPHLRWSDARKAVGKEVFISGKIINVNSVGRVNFLNFDAQRPAKFTGIIFREQLGNFPEPLQATYDGKIVRLRGRVTLYRNRPQIVLTQPEQIEILDELPPTTTEVPELRRTANADQLIIGSYNVLNLFDAEDDPYHADESTRPKPRRELEKLAQSMVSLNADVIALQEVESRGYLERFVEVFLPDMGYDHIVHFEGNDLRGIDVCLLSRVPIGAVRSHRHLRFPGPNDSVQGFSRDVLAVTVEPPESEPLDVWVVHLKSNSGGREFSEPVRLAEARRLRQLLDRELEGAPEKRLILLGDFNDVWGSPTLEIIVGSGPTGLWSAAADLPGAPPNTYNTGEHKSMIDFLLCSPSLAEQYVDGSFVVPPGSPVATGSDHNPVAATFRLR